ncbi:hypothetical protein CVT24_001332 [Panaeolus cyanescens]|uniref:Uncharacterized protein n=1 Tax=Panaeolus cyanescens TaxID=181874 RepID=A0A409W709_9AGAR|nr:hypothetical protein CVT24_001332 [Panaeolus cyanescens]
MIPHDIGEYEYRFYKSQADYERFTKPQWWNKPYGWTAFVPIKPIYDGPFACLMDAKVEKVRNEAGESMGYAISEKRVQQWLEVEHTIYKTISIIQKKYMTRPALPPMPTHYLKPLKLHTNRSAAIHHALRCRNWIGMWIAFLAFHLAHCTDAKFNDYSQRAETKADSGKEVEEWVVLLMSNGISQSFVHDLRTSKHVKDPYSIERTGVFVHLYGEAPDYRTIQWLLKNRVPIWYKWTDKLDAAARVDKLPTELVPPTELIDAAHTLGTTIVDDHEFANNGADDVTEIRKQRMINIASKPWEAFFKHRKSLEAARYNRETSSGRQARLEREMNPPTDSSNYWHWTFTANSMTTLTRIKLSSSHDPAIIGRNASQMKYYAWDDEWDICTHFGDDDEMDNSLLNDDDRRSVDFSNHMEDNDSEEIEDTPAEPGEEKGMHTAYFEIFSKPTHTPVHGGGSTLVDTTEDDNGFTRNRHGYIMLEDTDFYWIMKTYYGFVVPDRRLPFSHTSTREKQWNSAMQAMGRTDATRITDAAESSASAAVDFINQLTYGKMPHDDMYDLGSNNTINIPPNELKRTFYRLAKDLYAR